MKPKTCKVCKGVFEPFRPLQICCGHECAIQKAQKDRLKKAAKEKTMQRVKLRADKAKLKSRSDWMREAQTAFNSWVRLRDIDLPCISCGRYHTGQYHAGHYRTVGANPELRFNELNVARQCAPCNNHLHGNLVNYRIGLIARIGIEKVEWLESSHPAAKYSVEDLKAIKEKYSILARQIRNGV